MRAFWTVCSKIYHRSIIIRRRGGKAKKVDEGLDPQLDVGRNPPFPRPRLVISPNAMSLPQELIDEILDYLPLDDEQDQQSLRNCSLVAKSWTNPSRRRLFKIVEIGETNIQSWLDTIPPANNELLRHARSLYYITNAASWSDRQAKHRIDVLRDYLPSFHHLQHLSLSSMHIPSDISQQIEIFSAFRHTLSRLGFNCCTVTISAIVALINFFPNLHRLDLRYILEEADGEPASPLCRLLIRKLHISSFHDRGLGILDQLSELGLVFKELTVIEWSAKTALRILSRIVDSMGVNVKRLRLLRSETGPIRRSNCMYIRRAYCETC